MKSSIQRQDIGHHVAFYDCITSCMSMESFVATISKTMSVTTRRMFGNYFHSVVCHSAITYRQVNIHSLNTEYQERMYGQASIITKQCSKNQPQHVIDNAMLRIQAESTRLMKTFQQEGKVKELVATWSNPGNTFFFLLGRLRQILSSFRSTLRELVITSYVDHECGGSKQLWVSSFSITQKNQMTTVRVPKCTIYVLTLMTIRNI